MSKQKERKIHIQTKKVQRGQQRRMLHPSLDTSFEIFEDINRMYHDDPWNTTSWNPVIMNQALGNTQDTRVRLMPVDIIDKGSEYQIYTEMPGVDKDDVEITITPSMISICGATETNIQKEQIGYIRRERGYSTLCRYLRFPENVNPDQAEAILNIGILEITVHKKIPLEKKLRIPVKNKSKGSKKPQ